MLLQQAEARGETPPLHRFTVEEFHRLGESGVIPPEAHVELLEGVITDMSPISPRHAAVVDIARRVIEQRLPAGLSVRTQNPIVLDARSEPIPDLAVVVGTLVAFMDRHPGPREIEFVVEVADSTIDSDLNYKADLYARASIGAYLVLAVSRRDVHVFDQPESNGYARHQTFGGGVSDNMSWSHLLAATVVMVSPTWSSSAPSGCSSRGSSSRA